MIIKWPPSGGLCFGINMAIINLQLNDTDGIKLMAICEKDVQFVAAKTLTQTAQLAQTEIKKHLHDVFVLRKPNFEKSIKIRPATKQNLQSEIYTMAAFATLQQTGGKQTAQSGRLAVPQYDDLHELSAGRKARPAGSFLVNLRSGEQAIAKKTNGAMRILYYLKPLAYMQKRMNMLEIGTDTALKQIPALFRANLSQI